MLMVLILNHPRCSLCPACCRPSPSTGILGSSQQSRGGAPAQVHRALQVPYCSVPYTPGPLLQVPPTSPPAALHSSLSPLWGLADPGHRAHEWSFPWLKTPALGLCSGPSVTSPGLCSSHLLETLPEVLASPTPRCASCACARLQVRTCLALPLPRSPCLE